MNCTKFNLLTLALSWLLSSQLSWALAPKPGGTLIFGRGGDSVALDPGMVTDGESLNVTDHLFDNLVTYKEGTTELIPALAKSWKVSADGLVYTFSLREGVKFHDGESFDAASVVFTFMRQKDKNHPAYKYGAPYVYFESLGLNELIKQVKALDPLTVEFTLNRKDATFLACLGMQAFGIVSPKAVLAKKEQFSRQPIGTGPYKFVNWIKNQKIVLQSNEQYWGEKPYLQKVIFKSVPDNGTRLLEMMAGKIHVMDNPNPDDVKTLKEKLGDKVNLAKLQGLNVGYLALNNKKKPFDNVLVRQAIHHAINKKAIIESVYSGQGSQAKNPMPPTMWGYNDQIENYSYDVEKAKKLLAQAGLAKGFETTIWAMPVPRPYMPDGRKVAESIQGDLAKVGINAKIVSYEWGTYLEKTQNGQHDMALLGWTADIGDPDNFLYVLLDKDNAVAPAQNISFYESDSLHKILLQAKQANTHEERVKLYKMAQEIIHKDSPMIPIAHSIDVVPLSAKVKGFIMDPTGRRRFKRVWLEK